MQLLLLRTTISNNKIISKQVKINSGSSSLRGSRRTAMQSWRDNSKLRKTRPRNKPTNRML